MTMAIMSAALKVNRALVDSLYNCNSILIIYLLCAGIFDRARITLGISIECALIFPII